MFVFQDTSCSSKTTSTSGQSYTSSITATSRTTDSSESDCEVRNSTSATRTSCARRHIRQKKCSSSNVDRQNQNITNTTNESDTIDEFVYVDTLPEVIILFMQLYMK